VENTNIPTIDLNHNMPTYPIVNPNPNTDLKPIINKGFSDTEIDYKHSKPVTTNEVPPVNVKAIRKSRPDVFEAQHTTPLTKHDPPSDINAEQHSKEKILDTVKNSLASNLQSINKIRREKVIEVYLYFTLDDKACLGRLRQICCSHINYLNIVRI
jgi:hypothetical protein